MVYGSTEVWKCRQVYSYTFKEELHPNQKLACFVHFLQMINTFWKIIYASYS